MPYDIRRTSRCGENEWGLFLEETEELIACHTSRSDAQDQIQAIEAGKVMNNIIVSPTYSEIKDLDDKGTYGEYLINFGSKEEHDLEGDYFTKNTEFWLDISENKSAVLYGHGMDEVFGTKRLDKEGATLKQDENGIWMETQLQKRNEYEEMVHQLAQRGKLGLSSGTATHLVEREQVSEKDGKTIHEIKQWPLGLDATLTPTPAEPRVGKIRPVGEKNVKSIRDVAKSVLGISFKATQEEIEERYEDFQSEVNMSASEIEQWGETECADKASNNPETVRNRVIRLLRTNKDEWGDKEYSDAGKVISFISRMRGEEGGQKPSEDCPTKRDISLRNWGYDPMKSVADITQMVEEINSRTKGIGNVKFSQGDLVSWDDGSAQGRIVRKVGSDETVSPSSTDREFSGNENEDGYLIELVDYDQENDEVVGRDETVFHLEGSLTGISKSDVKEFVEQHFTKSLEGIDSALDEVLRKSERIV